MIPEGHVTLDSILEGILEDEESTNAPPPPGSVGSPLGVGVGVTPGGVGASPGGSSNSSFSPPSSSSFESDGGGGGGGGPLVHDPIPGIPCISIKTELPDSCSMDIMVSLSKN